jgi:tetratricopeptide (TPR) repeat protein
MCRCELDNSSADNNKSKLLSRSSWWALSAIALILNASALGADTSNDLLAKAKTHLSKGRYEEAEEVFGKAAAAKADPVAVALGMSRAKEAVGAWEEA